jgi:hypothetical protein
MSTQPVVPAPSSGNQQSLLGSMEARALSAEQQLIASLNSKHANVSYMALAILAVVIILALLGGWWALSRGDAAVAKADAQNVIFQNQQKDFMAQLAANGVARDAIVAEQSQIIANMSQRQIVTQQRIVEVQKITTQPEAVSALNSAYHFTFDPTNVPQLNTLTTTKIEHDSLQVNLNDETALFNAEKQKSFTLSTDLGTCTATLATCNQTVADYKKAVSRTKFQKFIGGAIKVLIFAGGVYIGKKL